MPSETIERPVIGRDDREDGRPRVVLTPKQGFWEPQTVTAIYRHVKGELERRATTHRVAQDPQNSNRILVMPSHPSLISEVEEIVPEILDGLNKGGSKRKQRKQRR